jgi:hypothetical protein
MRRISNLLIMLAFRSGFDPAIRRFESSTPAISADLCPRDMMLTYAVLRGFER